MVLATATYVALALAAAAAGASYYNTQKTAQQQDNQLSLQLQHEGKKQQEADAKVKAEVDQLAASTADTSRRKGLDAYSQALLQNKSHITAGLTPNIGGDKFKADSAKAAGDVQTYGANEADLLSRIDAPSQQRQDEAFGYGNLATDLSLIGRESQGQDFLDQLKLNRIRRSPGLDAFAAFAGGASSGMSGAGAGSAGGASGGISGVGGAGSGGNVTGYVPVWS